jgi:GNAT superfamily N-acetyltransferase
MISDGIITIQNTEYGELKRIHIMEQDPDTKPFICSYPLKKHRREYKEENIIYKSIYTASRQLVGFILFALDKDGFSLELRRIVINEKGRGYGKRAISLVDKIAESEFGRTRIWLDVYEDNIRAQHIYEANGYRHIRSTHNAGKRLKIYQKSITQASNLEINNERIFAIGRKW